MKGKASGSAAPKHETDTSAKTVEEVFRLLDEGKLTTEEAEHALDQIRRQKHNWIERFVQTA